MGLFDFLRGDSAEQAEREAAEARREAEAQRQEESLAQLKRGGLPLNAVERLQHQRATQKLPTHLWTSDLSVNEMALVHDAGFDPLGQVMGSSIYHVGWQWTGQGWRSYNASFELEVLSTAFSNARQLALGRLVQEAQLLGAHGVVGVRLKRRSTDWSGGSVEFQAIGTAIRERNRREPVEGEWPFLCALSGQDFWKLKQSGVTPVGLVAGNCTYYCIPGWQTQNVTQGGIFGGGWTNQELPEFTQSLFTAREITLERVAGQVQLLKGHGVMGMTIEYDAEPHEVDTGNHTTRLDMLYHFLALGTAVRVDHAEPKTQTNRVMSLGYMPVRPITSSYTGDI